MDCFTSCSARSSCFSLVHFFLPAAGSGSSFDRAVLLHCLPMAGLCGDWYSWQGIVPESSSGCSSLPAPARNFSYHGAVNVTWIAKSKPDLRMHCV